MRGTSAVEWWSVEQSVEQWARSEELWWEVPWWGLVCTTAWGAGGRGACCSGGRGRAWVAGELVAAVPGRSLAEDQPGR